MDVGLKGRTALVTGASAGLGAASALALAAEGTELIINSRSESKLTSHAATIADATGIRPTTVVADLSTESGISSLIEALDGRSVDIFVANAGGPPPGDVREHSAAAWDDAYRLVLRFVVRLTTYLLDGMVKRKWGRLIYITSIGVLQPVDELILSNTFRAGVTGFCKTISNHYASHGITANCVCPGYTATERLKSLAKTRAEATNQSVESVLREFAKMIPAGRIGQPDELASLVTYLAGNKSAYISGASIPVDGGLHKSLL
jgi:3-oxoacyl-[acyl-carrier protein] reductase